MTTEVQTTPNIGEVFITFVSKTVVIVDPYVGVLDRDHQVMTFRLVSDDPRVTFTETGGITFPDPPPPGYAKWPGETPKGDRNVYTADVAFKQPDGETALYRYSITLDTPDGPIHVDKVQRADTNEVIDPDIENRPQP